MTVALTVAVPSRKLLPSSIAEHELAGIDFFLTFLKQIATSAILMAVGLPVINNHLVMGLMYSLFNT